MDKIPRLTEEQKSFFVAVLKAEKKSSECLRKVLGVVIKSEAKDSFPPTKKTLEKETGLNRSLLNESLAKLEGMLLIEIIEKNPILVYVRTTDNAQVVVNALGNEAEDLLELK